MFVGEVLQCPLVIAVAPMNRVVHVVAARTLSMTNRDSGFHGTIPEFQIFSSPTQAHALIETTQRFPNGAIDGKLAASTANPGGCNIRRIAAKPALQVTLERWTARTSLEQFGIFNGFPRKLPGGKQAGILIREAQRTRCFHRKFAADRIRKSRQPGQMQDGAAIDDPRCGAVEG